MFNSKFKILILIIIPLVIVGFWQQSQAISNNNSPELQALNLKIQNQKEALNKIQAQQQEYQNKIRSQVNNQVTLNNQVAILNDRISEANLAIKQVNLEISKNTLETEKIKLDNQLLNTKIETQKQHLGYLLQALYQHDQISTLQNLLLNHSLTDFINQAQYLTNMNQGLSESVDNLKIQQQKLKQNLLVLKQKNDNLLNFKKQLLNKKGDLEYDQNNKNNLLATTQSSEQYYQALLQKGLRQQQQAEADISSAEHLVWQKMSKKDQTLLNSNQNSIAWPVNSRIIDATFHDPNYPFKKLIGQHSGIDIRVPQGTIIRAAADGYVARAKFNGSNNYAYIMLIHGHGLSTVYGHVSAIFVTADQYVSQGEAIGRSGGTPGTPGSGPFTTGPHLHFEVRLNGIPVNPMNYLP